MDVARSLAERALRDAVGEGSAHELLGRIALTQQQHEEAILHFKAASTKGRVSLELEKGWATALLNLGRNSEACLLMERSLSRDPTQVETRYQLATAYLAQGKSHEAWPHLEEAYRQGLRHAGVLLQLARIRFVVGQDERAVEFLEALTRDSSSPEFLVEIGKLLFERLYYARSQAPLLKAWQQRRGSYEVGMYLALSHYLLKQYRQSEAILTAMDVGLTPPLDYRILRGSVYARLGRWELARLELEKTVLQAPERADGFLNLGLYYLEQGHHQQAMELLEKGSKMIGPGTKILYSLHTRTHCQNLAPPQSIKTRDSRRSQSYSKLARALQDSEQWVSALEVYLLALRVDNLSSAPYGGIGLMCQKLNSPEVGRTFLQRGIELNPREADLYFALGLVQQSVRSITEAISSYEKAIELEEPNVPAVHWVQLGTAYLASATHPETKAEVSFFRALECDPNSARAHYELGKLYLKRNELDRAEQSFEKAIRFDPMLLRAYYQYGLACIRNGKGQKGKSLLEAYNRKRALRN